MRSKRRARRGHESSRDLQQKNASVWENAQDSPEKGLNCSIPLPSCNDLGSNLSAGAREKDKHITYTTEQRTSPLRVSRRRTEARLIKVTTDSSWEPTS